jgi:hypothetical protein
VGVSVVEAAEVDDEHVVDGSAEEAGAIEDIGDRATGRGVG